METIQIQTEFTPNPQSLKFNINRPLLEKGSLYFEDVREAEASSPLAARLFGIPHVEGVLIGQSFVTINRAAGLDTWGPLIEPVSQALREHLNAGEPVLKAGARVSTRGREPQTDVEKRIVQVLDSRVRPAIARDGGDIIFYGYRDGVVTLYLQGACSTCPSSIATLKQGVERMLCEFVPEVREVVQLN